MRQVGRSVQCRQNRRGRTAATWPFPCSDMESMTEFQRTLASIVMSGSLPLENPLSRDSAIHIA